MSEMPTPVGILAGRGNYPAVLADRLGSIGHPVVVAGLLGQWESRLFVGCTVRREFPVGAVSRVARFFVDHGVRRAFFAGGVQRRGVWRYFRPDLNGLLLLPRALLKGDNDLLTHTSKTFLQQGVEICDPAPCLAPLWADAGLLAGPVPDENLRKEMDAAHRAAVAFGRQDRGQAVIVYRGRLVDAEGRDGTDALIARAPGPGAVLAKVVKRGQDRRFDMPAIGASTALLASRVGLGAIVVEAGGVLLLERELLFARCDQRGISLVGY